MPDPVLPDLELEEGGLEEMEEVDLKDAGKEKLAASFARLLGFVAAIGLPPDVMKQKIEEYSKLAEETGVAEALIDTIDYYFPDMEMSPAIVLAISGIAFASAVMADRAEIKKRYETKKKVDSKPSSKEIVQKRETLKKQGVSDNPEQYKPA